MGEAKRRQKANAITAWPEYTLTVVPPWDEEPIKVPFSVHKPCPKFDIDARAMAIGGLIMSLLQEPTGQMH